MVIQADQWRKLSMHTTLYAYLAAGSQAIDGQGPDSDMTKPEPGFSGNALQG